MIAALSTHSIDDAIFHVANVLQIPVLILALLALATVIYELGSYAVEIYGRRRRHFTALAAAAEAARQALATEDRDTAKAAVSELPRSPAMARTLSFIIEHARTDGGDHQLNKALADFDFDAQRRLARTRMLVRAGPALGLMGTLIPLSPALTGLANGNTSALSQNLRVAFSVTVVGLLIGAVAFGLSLSRDRLYGQDLSDLEYLAAIVSDTRGGASPRTVPAPVLHAHPTAQPPAIREPEPLGEHTPPGGDS
ncbi:MAG: MotA/TolQ/ExbB proton channel family protein [Solirubrobacteraceae bacterium]